MTDFDKLVKAEARLATEDMSTWTGLIGEQQVELHASKITPHDTDRVDKKHPNWIVSASLGSMVEMIIIKAVDEHGSKVFQPTHKKIMMRWGGDKIGEIFGKLFGDQIEEIELDDEEFEGRVKN